MFAFDQIATRTNDIDQSINALGNLGHTNWVRDEVEAFHIYAHPAFDLGEVFKVRLAFNYEVFEGKEFELIQPVHGKTVQLGAPMKDMTSISHFGYHVQDPVVGGPDTLAAEINRLCGMGIEIVQVSQTVNHSGTKKRYRYAFGFMPAVGAPVKIIQRLLPGVTVEEGRQAFRWLSR